MSNQNRNFAVAKDKGRLKFWQNNPGVTDFEKGPDVINEDHLSTLNAAGTSELELAGIDANDKFSIGLSHFRPLRTPMIFRVQPNASEATAHPFFVAPNLSQPIEITQIDCIFDTADGVANTGYISKEGAGVAPGSGLSVMSGTFNLNATANTLQTATLVAARGAATNPSTRISLAAGEQLTFNIASAVTSLKGLVVIVWTKSRRVLGLPPATYYINANGSIATKTIYLNVIPGTQISAIAMRWSTAGSNGSAVTADVTKDTGTTAPGGGTSVLTAAQSVKGTINTTVYPALTATAATLLMAAGDRLAVKMTGTLTALAGLVVTVYFTAQTSNILVIPGAYFLNQNVDQTVFIADAHYEVYDHWGTWSTISTSVKALLTKDGGTTAPGAGTALLSDNTNAGLDTNATANTPVEGTLVTAKPSLILAPGDRLGSKFTGTTGSFAGFTTATVLRRI